MNPENQSQPQPTKPAPPSNQAAPVQPAVAPAASVATAGTSAYAGFWRRFAAAFIDGVIIGIVMVPVLTALSLKNPDMLVSSHPGQEGPGYWIQFGTHVFYAVVLLHLWQATVGKKALGIKVTAIDGSKPPVEKLVVRELMKVVSGAILLIGYLMMVWDDKKQTLHDKVAGTVIVKN